MLPVFMGIAARRNPLFYARCGAKDFFDKLKGSPKGFLFFWDLILLAGAAQVAQGFGNVFLMQLRGAEVQQVKV